MHRGRTALRPRPALWLSYGIAARNLALIVPNGVALLIGASTIAIAVQLGHGTSGGR